VWEAESSQLRRWPLQVLPRYLNVLFQKVLFREAPCVFLTNVGYVPVKTRPSNAGGSFLYLRSSIELFIKLVWGTAVARMMAGGVGGGARDHIGWPFCFESTSGSLLLEILAG
jgi:hypothetical protein